MAAGDYGPGTCLEPIVLNVTVGPDGVVDHVGIGYHIVTPSGAHHAGGWTWHSPKAGVEASTSSTAALQAVIDEILSAAAEREGVQLSVSRA